MSDILANAWEVWDASSDEYKCPDNEYMKAQIRADARETHNMKRESIAGGFTKYNETTKYPGARDINRLVR